MTNLVALSSLIGVISLCSHAGAFTTPLPRSSLSSLQLYMEGATREHVRSNGGGIPLVPSGGLSLFDPNEAGKLGDTNACLERIQQGSSYQFLSSSGASSLQQAPPPGVELIDAQHWLEDIGIPVNFAKPQNPAIATLLGRQRIISDDAPGDIQHIVLQLPEGMHYVEGQSISVIPPGLDSKGKANKPRLYSIASTRYGDLLDGKTVCLCVRRAEYVDPDTGIVDVTKQGVCSNFLCDAQPGTQIHVAGPIGKTMLLPQDPNTDIIMVATGTGIAPFRAFLHRLFMENTVARHLFNAKAWLILGVPVTGGLLYPDEFQYMQQTAAITGSSAELEVTYAISREMKNSVDGGKYYVQHVLAERADELFERLQNGAHIYFCGLKGMMPGILTALEQVAATKGVVWADKLKELQAKGQWHVEVY
jgi:ferredoxin--NADP+ reductase